MIESQWANDTLNDLALNGLSNALTLDGQSAMSGQLKLSNGTVSIPALTFSASTSTGLYRPGTNLMAATVTGIEAMRWASTGAVLIGQTSDDGANKLQVTGNAKITGALEVTGTQTFGGNVTVAGTFAANGGTTLGDSSGDALTINSNPITAPNGIRIQSNFAGNALIVEGYSALTNAPAIVSRKARGTTASPTAVQADDFLAGLLGAGWQSGGAFGANVAAISLKAAESYTATNQGSYITFDATAIGAIARSERMRITGDAVGIGTTTPTANGLTIESLTAGQDTFARLRAAGTDVAEFRLQGATTAATLRTVTLAASTGDHIIGTLGTGATRLFTSNIERARYDTSGNYIVGGTAAVVTAANRGNVTVNGATSAIVALSVANTPRGYFYADTASAELNSAGNLTFVANGAERARLDINGSLLVGLSSTLTANAKIQTSDGAITSVYGYKTGGTENLGTISAHPLGFLTGNSTRMTLAASGALFPSTDVLQNLGAPANRWASIFGGTFSMGTASEVLTSSSTNLIIGPGSAWTSQVFQVGGSNRMVLDSGGLLAGANNTYALGTSGTRWSNTYSVLGNYSGLLTASAGVNFGNASSGTSTAPGWYETGSFTPTVSGATVPGTITYTDQVGRFTRWGRLIYVYLEVAWNGIGGGSGNMQITGFPYAFGRSSKELFAQALGSTGLAADTFFALSTAASSTVTVQARNQNTGANSTVALIANQTWILRGFYEV